MIAEEEFAQVAQRPSLELIQPSFGSSISYQRFNDETPNGEPLWHYHPEFELVYIRSGHGKRHVGNHISYYTSGDLILIGSNLPHYGFNNRLTARNTEVVIQFRRDFLGSNWDQVAELAEISELLSRSQHGVTWGKKTKLAVGKLLDAMDVMSHFDRLLQTVRVLQLMSSSSDYELLNVSKATIEVNKQDKERIKVVYDHVRRHFQR
ncbi:MAG: cupin domain-containing protein, partial [Bacteroidota bacterium]